MHMDDYKVVEEEAEHTPMLVTGRDPKPHTAPLKLPLLWATVTHPYILMLLVLSMATPPR